MVKGLILDQVQIHLPSGPIIAPISLKVAPGEILSLIGPSGVGKSSLLAALAGTLTPPLSVTGQAFINGEPLFGCRTEKRGMALVFQDDLLFDHMSVAGNLSFGLSSSVRGANRRRSVAEALRAADLEGFEGRSPTTLSGGQRSRVALMRALLSAPLGLLLDEPYSRLDADLRAAMRRFVSDQVARAQIPALLVTHDISDTPSGDFVTVTPAY